MAVTCCVMLKISGQGVCKENAMASGTVMTQRRSDMSQFSHDNNVQRGMQLSARITL